MPAREKSSPRSNIGAHKRTRRHQQKLPSLALRARPRYHPPGENCLSTRQSTPSPPKAGPQFTTVRQEWPKLATRPVALKRGVYRPTGNIKLPQNSARKPLFCNDLATQPRRGRLPTLVAHLVSMRKYQRDTPGLTASRCVWAHAWRRSESRRRDKNQRWGCLSHFSRKYGAITFKSERLPTRCDTATHVWPKLNPFSANAARQCRLARNHPT